MVTVELQFKGCVGVSHDRRIKEFEGLGRTRCILGSTSISLCPLHEAVDEEVNS